MSSDTAAPLRRALLAILLAGSLGAGIELCLIGHYEDPWQWAPLALLGAFLVAGLAAALAPAPATLAAFRAIALACLIAGAAGVWLHYDGNREFELEMYPNRAGWELFTETITGATPVLAPGTMSVIGLLGLLYGWRHPAARR